LAGAALPAGQPRAMSPQFVVLLETFWSPPRRPLESPKSSAMSNWYFWPFVGAVTCSVAHGTMSSV
jgi:hypothetical protein